MKSKLKLYVTLFILALLILLGSFTYAKYREFSTLINSAESIKSENALLRSDVETFNNLKENLEQEVTRCEQLLLKEEGNFAEFSYCQRFVSFFDTLTL